MIMPLGLLGSVLVTTNQQRCPKHRAEDPYPASNTATGRPAWPLVQLDGTSCEQGRGCGPRDHPPTCSELTDNRNTLSFSHCFV